MIEVNQVCDGCASSRQLPVGLVSDDLIVAAKKDGWREVRADKHLCPKCITTALRGDA